MMSCFLENIGMAGLFPKKGGRERNVLKGIERSCQSRTLNPGEYSSTWRGNKVALISPSMEWLQSAAKGSSSE